MHRLAQIPPTDRGVIRATCVALALAKRSQSLNAAIGFAQLARALGLDHAGREGHALQGLDYAPALPRLDAIVT